ncbi:MAG: cytochrome C oxidase subunit IV family protein [Terracidiphilus sp.]
MSEPNNEMEQGHHIVGPKIYLVILLLLLIGTATTVAVSYIDLGIWNPVLALAIATGKMMLVVLFFMHIKYSPRLIKLTAASGIFLFLVLISLTLTDYMSRAWGRW